MKYLHPQWKPVLSAIGLGDFEAVWEFPLERIDQPNTGRGGWSEVCYYALPESAFGVKALYIKRQQDHGFFDWRHPFRGLPTFQREYDNLVWCLDRDIPVVNPVTFSVRDDQSHRQAILITQALDENFSLDDNEAVVRLGVRLRRAVVGAVANVIKRLHDEGVQHGCLYPKHIFVNRSCQQGEPISIRLIDLEKLAKFSFWNKGVYRDLDTLNRRSYGWSLRDRYCFLRFYCGGNKEEIRRVINKLSK